MKLFSMFNNYTKKTDKVLIYKNEWKDEKENEWRKQTVEEKRIEREQIRKEREQERRARRKERERERVRKAKEKIREEQKKLVKEWKDLLLKKELAEKERLSKLRKFRFISEECYV